MDASLGPNSGKLRSENTVRKRRKFKRGSDSFRPVTTLWTPWLAAQTSAASSAGVRNRKAGHSLAPWSRSSDDAPGFVSSGVTRRVRLDQNEKWLSCLVFDSSNWAFFFGIQ
jgi:hypothetical protein